MTEKAYRPGEAYAYPLILKKLLLTALVYSPEREIVYRDRTRITYRTLNERIGRLADGLRRLGVGPGDVVAAMEFDSHRYLECFFAVPMMGAILQTVNVRLSPEQILYTLNHAKADVVMVNSEFFPILQQIAGELETVKTFVLISDEAGIPAAPLAMAGEYEALLAAADSAFDFPDFDENAQATTFYTTGTTGNPKGVYFSPPTGAAYPGLCRRAGWRPQPGAYPPRRRVHADDPDVPRPRLGLPLSGDDAGRQAGLSRALPAGRDLPPDQ